MNKDDLENKDDFQEQDPTCQAKLLAKVKRNPIPSIISLSAIFFFILLMIYAVTKESSKPKSLRPTGNLSFSSDPHNPIII